MSPYFLTYIFTWIGAIVVYTAVVIFLLPVILAIFHKECYFRPHIWVMKKNPLPTRWASHTRTCIRCGAENYEENLYER